MHSVQLDLACIEVKSWVASLLQQHNAHYTLLMGTCAPDSACAHVHSGRTLRELGT